MSAVPPIPWPALETPWSVTGSDVQHLALHCTTDSGGVHVWLDRPICGRLRGSYPAGAHDLAVYLGTGICGASNTIASALGDLCRALYRADPRCRRVVIAAAAEDDGAAEILRHAGLRRVTEIDLDGRTVILAVAEPEWVTRADSRLGVVPGS